MTEIYTPETVREKIVYNEETRRNEYPSIKLGRSDVCRLIFASRKGAEGLMTDALYTSATVVDGSYPISTGHVKVYETRGWLIVYDDDGEACSFCADNIKVYRIGKYGWFVQLIDEQR